jgi:protein tyrosine phosphatase (PTP) superfamily phosphohydrolase (DUF442 family)
MAQSQASRISMIQTLRTALRNHRARRRARLATWRAGWSADLNAPGARRAAYYDMHVLDHGLIRLLWKNRSQIAPGIWRGNQPAPGDVAGLAAMGIRTIINFRGKNQWGSYLLEAEACAVHGITLVNGRLYSSTAPKPAEIHAALDLIEAAEKPVFMHCKSGADRAGLAAALYLLAQGADPAEAARQLSWKRAHLRISRTGILDAFIAAYAEAHEKTGIGFLDWVDTEYDFVTLASFFSDTRVTFRLVDWILRRE